MPFRTTFSDCSGGRDQEHRKGHSGPVAGSMESRIWREKVMLVYHVSHMEDGALAKDMLEELVTKLQGLAGDVKRLCSAFPLRSRIHSRQKLEDRLITSWSKKYVVGEMTQ